MDKNSSVIMGIGVGIIVLNPDNEVLLLLRNSDKDLADSSMRLEGTYTLPSGKVLFGEDFENAAIRKLKEESNLSVLKEDLRVISLACDKNEYAQYATIGLIATKYTGKVCIKTPEFTDFKWVKFDNLPSNLCIPSKTIISNYLNNTFYTSIN